MCKRDKEPCTGRCGVCRECGDPVPEGMELCPICEDAAAQHAFEAAMLASIEEDEHDG